MLPYDEKYFDLAIYDHLCAFYLFTTHGYETAVSIYPEQGRFILQHMDKSIEELRQEFYERERFK